jgi:hypothetical protein
VIGVEWGPEAVVTRSHEWRIAPKASNEETLKTAADEGVSWPEKHAHASPPPEAVINLESCQ